MICFKQLTEDNFRAIAGIMLGELKDVMAARGMALSWDDKVIDYLVKEAYSVTYGARNLRRTIQKQIEDAIAARMIELRGYDCAEINLSEADGKIVINQ